MIWHNLFYYPYASFTNAQLPLLNVVRSLPLPGTTRSVPWVQPLGSRQAAPHHGLLLQASRP